MTRRIFIVVATVMAALGAVASAPAQSQSQSEADRLRDALRAATAQARQLEDERAALQGKIAEAEREKAAAKAQIDAAKAEVRRVRKEQREAIDEFNRRLAERDETLEKWKAAYEEAATVARTKDAERARFEGEAKAYKASAKSCGGKNKELLKAGGELLERYKSVTVGDAFVAQEPMFGLGRVEVQNQIQTTCDRILDQRVQQ